MIPDKDTIRRDVWEKLLQVAIPNAFFRLNFAEVIPDFVGSENAVQAIRNQPRWRASQLMFLTPDDISALRVAAYEDGKRFVISTYGITGGLLYVDPLIIPEHRFEYAATLEGLERLTIEGLVKHISFAEIRALGGFDLLITGAFAVSKTNWVRFGKGHGYFDMEAAMFWDAGCMNGMPFVICIVHDYQVIDHDLPASQFDTKVDAIFTNASILRAPSDQGHHPTSIDWSKLPEDVIAGIPPLVELRRLQRKEKHS